VSVVPNLFDVPEIRADYAYTMCDFEDDDFSAMLRRTGFQQILAKDTFVHHFGGVTLKDVRNLPKNRSSIARMRPVFRDKWHVDPWQSRGHVELIDTFLDQHNAESPVRALVIEPLFGEGLLRIRNYFHQQQKEVVIDAVVTDERYLPDSQYLADTVRYLPTLDHFAEQVQEDYDIILVGTYLNRLPITKILPFFQACHERLRPQGGIHCRILNRHSFGHIMQMLSSSAATSLTYEEPVPLDGERIFSINELIEALRTHLPQIALQVYGYQTRYFQQRDSFAALMEELLDCTEQEKIDLHYSLSADIVVLYLS
jgi:family 2 glycosyl transferase